ncbi:hypothetical protein [Fodinibius halophilus]|uniref:DUF5673 domain-containing protein n=1 Tax=Fodinibius halophilus TaxID=1736908 RepID=A0A6M1T250_9BACT|nr:hypothetical protein [Fodinibius halophilus]NGP88069.1 hypothetical protein [Fodinibius halophilus]
MYLLITVLGVGIILSFVMGYKRIILLSHLNKHRVVAGFVSALALFSLLSTAQWLQLISKQLAIQTTMLLYCLIAGFFLGFATKMLQLRKQAKNEEYIHRSFWTQTAPSLIALAIILFGLSRTGLLWLGPYTGIGITSGLSLIGFGCWGFTINVVPEFRRKGILILDQYVPWPKVVSHSWVSEQVLCIEYYNTADELTDFTTYIPVEDRYTIEQLLTKKLKEHQEERKKMVTEN